MSCLKFKWLLPHLISLLRFLLIAFLSIVTLWPPAMYVSDDTACHLQYKKETDKTVQRDFSVSKDRMTSATDECTVS